MRVIIPPKGREKLLDELHEGHTGMNKTKNVARSYMWWPNMDKDIESRIKCCEICQMTQNCPSNAPLHPWQWPERPWSRLHIDYAGPFMGKMFLIIVDAYSKWMDVYPVHSANTLTTIEKLRQSFAIQGLPDMIVSDNGSCFTSTEFENFTKQNGIKHVKVAPYHPSSNGLAERGVQTFKEGMKKQKQGTIETKVSRFLFSYRTNPQSTTGITPSEMLMGRHLKTRLDLIKPDVGKRVQEEQFRQKLNHDKKKLREFKISDTVWVENKNKGDNWLKGIIVDKTGPLSYLVKLTSNDIVVRKHIDQLREREEMKIQDSSNELPEAQSEFIPREAEISSQERLETDRQEQTEPNDPLNEAPPANVLEDT